ncbi:rod shape-determining protein MreB [Abditibacteriota bacterium]|nr:rod shape-determining protein MreB [Abditibacteriota bacterium]
MLSRDLGIDLGTSNLRVFQRKRGVIVSEASVVAYAKGTPIPRAYGTEAARLIGRSPDTLEISHPIRGGAIASFSSAQALIQHYVNMSGGLGSIWRPRVVVSVSSGITAVERQALLDACRLAGARAAYSVESPMAAALGLGLPISDPQGHMILDVGGGTSDVAVTALGGVVVSDSARVGGEDFDEAIHRSIKRNHSIVIGEKTAEDVKFAVGSAWELPEELEIEVRGRDMTDGMPKVVRVSSVETRIAIYDLVGQIVSRVRSVLERTPPELVNDISQSGLWLTGGSAHLRGLAERLEFETGLSVHRSNSPETNVINGLGQTLDYMGALSESHLPLVHNK